MPKMKKIFFVTSNYIYDIKFFINEKKSPRLRRPYLIMEALFKFVISGVAFFQIVFILLESLALFFI